MDLTPLRCLVNSISRFIHLVTSRISNAIPAEKDYRDIVSFLKHLKPVLDDVTDSKIPPDEAFLKECEELDISVNEARELLEKWSPKTSKILYLLHSTVLVQKIQMSSVKLSSTLCELSESSPTKSSLSNAQLCMQECQNLRLGQLSECIEEILKCQKDGEIPAEMHLAEIVESLKLKSSQELLNEYIAIEKERVKVNDSGTTGKFDEIVQAVEVMSHIRGYASRLMALKASNGVQVPSYFCCPLSLELMSDPVILASGQTYERAAIETWLDCGLERCPQTGQKLSHKNLIPNYTVKALVTNWCQENNIELLSKSDNANVDEGQFYSEQTVHKNDLQHPLERENLPSRCSLELARGFGSEMVNEEPNHICRGETEKFDQSSAEHSYVHSRSESTSTVVSSVDCVPMEAIEIRQASSKHDGTGDGLQDIKSACLTPLQDRISGASPLCGKQSNSSKGMPMTIVNGHQNPSRVLSYSSDSDYGELTSRSHVEELVSDLKSDSTEMQSAAARELRYLAKYNMENRIIIGECGAIAPLISLLHSDVELAQEHAVTALLNLSICESIKVRIAEEGAIEPLIHVLRTGNSASRENAAATLFSISLLEEYRIKIGRSDAIKALVDLLESGTIRGKKDAATALFNLSIFHENKARIVQAGAVKYLIGLMDPASEMVDKAVALLANLSTIPEGCSAIARHKGIPLVVEVLETGSQRGKENAASILLQLCLHSEKYCRIVLQEGAVPPLVLLSQSGTLRAKEKAQQLLSHFRSQRESGMGRGQS